MWGNIVGSRQASTFDPGIIHGDIGHTWSCANNRTSMWGNIVGSRRHYSNIKYIPTWGHNLQGVDVSNCSCGVWRGTVCIIAYFHALQQIADACISNNDRIRRIQSFGFNHICQIGIHSVEMDSVPSLTYCWWPADSRAESSCLVL